METDLYYMCNQKIFTQKGGNGMIYKRVKLVAMLIVMCMLITLLPAGKTEKYEASEKVGEIGRAHV